MEAGDVDCERLCNVFRQFDPKGTGRIKRTSLSDVLKDLGISSDEIENLLSHYDSAGSDPIRYERFLAWILSGAQGSSVPAALGVDALPECKFRIFHINDVYILDHFPSLKAHVANMGTNGAFGDGCSDHMTTLAGDFVAPSLLSSMDHGMSMIDCMNKVPVDAVCFGNHESDIPITSLCRRIQEYKGQWINTNMPKFRKKLPEHYVRELPGGRKVGFLGLNIAQPTVYRKGAFGGAAKTIKPILDCAPVAAEKLRSEHPDVDCILPLTHQDAAEDVALAKMGLFPVVLAGHDHGVFEEWHDDCLVVKAGENAYNVFVIDLYWPAGAPKGAKPKVTSQLIPLAAPKGSTEPFTPLFEPNDEMVNTVRRWKEPADELRKSVMCRVSCDPPLSSVGTRLQPSSMATFIASALRDQCAAEGCIVNAGSVRGNHEYTTGEITYAQLNFECPFDTPNIIIELLGSTLIEAVIESRELWVTEPGVQANNAIHCDDKMKVDPATHTVLEVNGAPINPHRYYRIVLNTYTMQAVKCLKAYRAANPSLIPPDDAGQTALCLLVAYFCDQTWKTLCKCKRSDSGSCHVDPAAIDHFFDKADKTHNGRIQVGELRKALEEMLGNQMATGVVAKRMLKIVDFDHDGTVSREELHSFLDEAANCHARSVCDEEQETCYVELWTNLINLPLEQKKGITDVLAEHIGRDRLDDFFNVFDVNQDGVLDREEVLSAIRKCVGQDQATEDNLKAVFNLCDHSQTGTLTKCDFKAVWDGRHLVDPNKD